MTKNTIPEWEVESRATIAKLTFFIIYEMARFREIEYSCTTCKKRNRSNVKAGNSICNLMEAMPEYALTAISDSFLNTHICDLYQQF